MTNQAKKLKSTGKKTRDEPTKKNGKENTKPKKKVSTFKGAKDAAEKE